MRAPRGGWLLAAGASTLLTLLLAFGRWPAALETFGLSLKHQSVALLAGRERPSTSSADAVAAVGGPRNRLGANVLLEQEVETSKRQLALELLRDAGVGWIRQELPWEQIEPAGKGNFTDPKFNVETWQKFDEILGLAESRGFQVVFRLDTAPRWALPAGAPDGLGPPVNLTDYWDFVEAAALRYRGRVLGYQIWNEPNLDIEWGRQAPDPAGYAILLKGAAERIRRADPSALVVLAALAPTLTYDEHARNELVYLQQLYDAGVRGSFDVLAVQAYGLRGGPDDPRDDDADVTFSRPRRVREVMVRNGDGGLPVWATELGWNTSPPGLDGEPYGRVTPELQARYTVRALERARQEWPWLQAEALWFLKLPEHWDARAWHFFALLDPDFRPRPVYFAVRDDTARAR